MEFSAVAAEMKLSERMVRTYVVRALLHCRAHLGKLDVNNVSQLFLRVIRNARNGDVLRYANPLVFLCVMEVSWIHSGYFARL